MQWNTISIETARLSLRPFSPKDADEAFDCITSTLTRYMSFDPPTSKTAFETIWRSWLNEIEAGIDFTFAIRTRPLNGFIGLAGLHRVQEPEPELGIWVRENEHGHAYGREAVASLAGWAAKTLHVASFVYPVAEENMPSRRIAESLGGTVVGRHATQKYNALIYRIPVR
ncbi:GNAT family N-acetyltransferase [Ottowia thiooxydans]|uniref:RimJ/RimL family protein N-acetyltransferase n=1 Tax=Ottowia thiooxydans TaxID=219182 RepID=A0ABV2Q4K2_9BURK